MGESVLLIPAPVLPGNSNVTGVTGSEVGTCCEGLMRRDPTFDVDEDVTRGLLELAVFVVGAWVSGSLGDALSGSTESLSLRIVFAGDVPVTGCGGGEPEVIASEASVVAALPDGVVWVCV